MIFILLLLDEIHVHSLEMYSEENHSRYPRRLARSTGETLRANESQLTAMRPGMLSERKLPMNPPGFVPLFGQGLVAKETQLGAIGTKEWMKSIKLHKYWPLVSHWSYWQMLALTEDNMEYNIRMVGGTEITCGAQGKLLRSIEELRQRKPRLKKIIDALGSSRTSLQAEILYLKSLVHTPLPTSEDDSLPTLIVHSVHKIREFIALRGNSLKGDKNMDKIVWAIKQNPILNKAENRLKRLPILWEMQLTLTNYAVKSSRILPLIQHERNRTISVDSGFEENSDSCMSKKEVSSTCPIGIRTVMLELPKGDERQKIPLHSPFCFLHEDKSDEEDLNIF